MAIVFQKDKRSGITYAYDSKAYWDKEKKQSRAKRKLIGRVDEKTGEIVPTRGTNRKGKQEKVSSSKKRGSVPAAEVSRSFCGATYLLDALGEKLGLISDLKKCFPDRYKQILSIAYYLILEDNNPLRRQRKMNKGLIGVCLVLKRNL